MRYRVGQFVRFTVYAPLEMCGAVRKINYVDRTHIGINDVFWNKDIGIFIPDREHGGCEDWVKPIEEQLSFIF